MRKKLKRPKAETRLSPRYERVAFLGSLCLFLSTIEYMLPRPLPFIRAGLANMPLVIALFLPLPDFALLALLKVLLQAIVSGSLFSYIFLFSVSGTAVSAAAMRALYKICGERISAVGLSVAGAFLSNAAQIFLARIFILGESAFFIAPPLLAAGVVSGCALGLFCAAFTKQSRWYTILKETPPSRTFALNVVVLPKSRRPRIFMSVTVFAGIVAFNLFAPHGKVLASIGAFSITEGALFTGVKKALLLQIMVILSAFFLRRPISFPGFAGRLLKASFGFFARLGSPALVSRPLLPALDRALICAYTGENGGQEGN